VQIVWNALGGFCYIPLEAQERLLGEMGREKYIKLPSPGTNPRGVEITKEALSKLVRGKETRIIEVNWQRAEIDFNPYKRWVDYWREG